MEGRRYHAACDAARGSGDEHRVAVGQEAVARGDGVAVGREDALAPGERGDEHEQGRARGMEVREEGIHEAEGPRLVDEDLRAAAAGNESARGVACGLED